MKIRTKLLITLVSIAAGVITMAAIFSVLTVDSYFRSRLADELKVHCTEIEFLLRPKTLPLDSGTVHDLRALAHEAGFRLTIIRSDGAVAVESELPEERVSGMENHLLRPEVQEASRDRFGSATRHSATLDLEMFYLAKAIPPDWPASGPGPRGGFIRIGLPLTRVAAILAAIRSNIVLTSVMLFAAAVAVMLLVSRRLAKPIVDIDRVAALIRAGDLSQRLPVKTRDELGALCETLNSMLDKVNEDISRLRKLERVRSEFLGNVSHELRTPIFAIQGMLETLLQGALADPEVSREFVDRALHNTRRLNTLLGDLIEISRIESGEMKLSFRYFSLREFLNEAALEASAEGEKKQISVSLAEVPPRILVYGDKERLRQVLNNLTDNAIKYTAAGGHVTIAAAASEGKASISVSDTGTGIPAEHLSRIFERFYRVDRERSREAGGTGLGLAIVKHIIEAHDSEVIVTSEPGKGSTFAFTLRTSYETEKHQENRHG